MRRVKLTWLGRASAAGPSIRGDLNGVQRSVLDVDLPAARSEQAGVERCQGKSSPSNIVLWRIQAVVVTACCCLRCTSRLWL